MGEKDDDAPAKQCCKLPIWVWATDCEGDAEIPGGLNDCSGWECQNCGAWGGDGEEPEWRDV